MIERRGFIRWRPLHHRTVHQNDIREKLTSFRGKMQGWCLVRPLPGRSMPCRHFSLPVQGGEHDQAGAETAPVIVAHWERCSEFEGGRANLRFLDLLPSMGQSMENIHRKY
jgi:hypothetical protein